MILSIISLIACLILFLLAIGQGRKIRKLEEELSNLTLYTKTEMIYTSEIADNTEKTFIGEVPPTPWKKTAEIEVVTDIKIGPGSGLGTCIK